MNHWFKRSAALVTVSVLAACSDQGGGVPQRGGAVTGMSPGSVRSSIEIARSRLAHVSRPQANANCTTINGAYFDGFTAAVVLTGKRTQDVDGTGCDIAVYVPVGATASLNSINVSGGGTWQVAVDDEASLRISNTNVTNSGPGQPLVAVIEAVSNLQISGSTILQDGTYSAIEMVNKSNVESKTLFEKANLRLASHPLLLSCMLS